MSQNETFEAECRALYERHQMVGFFTWMGSEDTATRGQLRAAKEDKVGVLIGAQNLSAQLLTRFERSRRTREAVAGAGGAASAACR